MDARLAMPSGPRRLATPRVLKHILAVSQARVSIREYYRDRKGRHLPHRLRLQIAEATGLTPYVVRVISRLIATERPPRPPKPLYGAGRTPFVMRIGREKMEAIRNAIRQGVSVSRILRIHHCSWRTVHLLKRWEAEGA